MKIIEIVALENGAHRNQTLHGRVPDGWARIPENMQLPETFPFVDLVAEGGVVTAMTANQTAYDAAVAGEAEREPTDSERIAALEAENKALKEQQTFLEDCILEMADVVYA